ncbi:cellular nucleic acid-binding protein [[Emmonsia] crescens]|uniref:Cellular nucleic acid-binding protein n=1 Tax=[Emmonsia] crescens TaxID=73230 RepID=A0A0G2I788_9EURO|nr:cellular nucleic acid-binding protein [Emmonsia crescens UAMH 3008]
MSRMVARVLAQQKVRITRPFVPVSIMRRHINNSFPAAKQCYHCQGLGHVQADCPTLRINGGATSGRCYNCNLPGHLARNCPSAGMQGAVRGAPAARGGFNPSFRGGFAAFPRAATCYKCGGPNHFARDCQAQAMKCYACGKLGHISRDCTAPNGGPLSSAGKVCYKCSQAGHISRDCPTNTNEGVATNAAEPAAEAVAADNVAPVAPAPTTAVA